jgi:hypothetical protein
MVQLFRRGERLTAPAVPHIADLVDAIVDD